MDKTRWRKTARSDGASNCVEVHPAGLVRDSKHPSGPVLRVELRQLLLTAKTVTFGS
ncbi:DUF397 domain-containing protein [Actinokineospora sp. NPDC004072]